MRIVGNNIAVFDSADLLSQMIQSSGRLDHDDGIAVHYVPHITKGNVVIDAGAALGDHTIAYVRAAGDPKLVHAFEPNPKMVECLRHNVPGCHIHPVALSDEDGTMIFYPEKFNLGASMVFPYNNPKIYKYSFMKKISVPCARLDSFIFDPICFIKWDIEGSELRGLKGARHTIDKHKPIMILEVNGPVLDFQGTSSHELISFLESDLGYKCTTILGDIPNTNRGELLCRPK